ncbi:phage tail tube protein [Bosea lathyri]|uniref:Phage tail tube protein n=1 Tax=Bosea lathyri TaxID=1036778 RepID=A0A1H6BFJ0_9HYPH|nr:phage tail tube protein [Bosea lathyri]SEG59095.1 Phage tail tube protein [Bosea lathyri]
MAQPTVLSFGKGLLYLGDGASPEVFTKICGFNSIKLTIDKDTNDVTIPDCDDPDAPAWKATDVLNMGWSAEFEGISTKEGEPLLWAAINRAEATSLRLRMVGFGSGSGTPDLQFSGKAHIAGDITGQRGSKWQTSAKATGDGALTRTMVAALT